MLRVRSLVVLVVAAIGAVLLVAPPAGAASPPGQLSSGEQLHRNQSLVSANGKFSLVVDGSGRLRIDGPVGMTWGAPGSGGLVVMQGDGNLVNYSDTTGKPVWATGTGTPGSMAVMQDDGNLVVYAPGGRAVWASKSEPVVLAGSPDRILTGQRLIPSMSLKSANAQYQGVLQNDGNFVVYGPSGVVWATGTAAPYTMVTMQADGNLVMYDSSSGPPDVIYQPLWHTWTGDPSGTLLILQNDGALVVYRPDGTPLWTSKTSTGTKIVRDVLSAGARLRGGLTMVSADFRFRAVMQRDGNFVVYGPNGPNWASRTGRAWSSLLVTSAGDTVLTPGQYDAAVWHSGTAGNPGAVLVLQNDGNLVVYAPGGRPVWASLSPWTWNSAPLPAAPRNGWW